jgi:uncharacterized membrane protein YcaP (DUF421 family)
MKKDEIKLDDWQRILFGEAPFEFMLETLIRAVIIYIFFLIIMRLLGKRMSGQHTLTELAVLVTLGAIISAPMQIPERGIFQAIVVLICALIFHRLISWLEFLNPKLETITQGKASMLVKDGRLMLEEMSKVRITRPQLFSTLRNKKIVNLGTVRRVYLEACGMFSVYTFDGERQGLALWPTVDTRILKEKDGSANGSMACRNCGNVVKEKTNGDCSNCGYNEWTTAILN